MNETIRLLPAGTVVESAATQLARERTKRARYYVGMAIYRHKASRKQLETALEHYRAARAELAELRKEKRRPRRIPAKP